jgi:hypothetical protein
MLPGILPDDSKDEEEVMRKTFRMIFTGGIGDAILTTPTFRALKEHNPLSAALTAGNVLIPDSSHEFRQEQGATYEYI